MIQILKSERNSHLVKIFDDFSQLKSLILTILESKSFNTRDANGSSVL